MGDWIANLNAPAGPGLDARVTRFLHDVYLGRPDLQRAYPDLTAEADAAGLVEWAHRSGRHEIPIPDELLPPPPSSLNGTRPASRLPLVGRGEGNWWGVNVAGYLQGTFGLGEAGRLTVRALDGAGIPALPVELAHLPDIGHRQPYGTVETFSPPFPISVVCANPDHLWEWAGDSGRRFFEGRHTIGFWWWEVLDGPIAEWLLPGEIVDEVWVGSRHVADAVAPMTKRRVSVLRLPVEVARPRGVDRRSLGLPVDQFLFLFAFDYNSTLARKNPIGLIEAFSSAFPPGGGAALVLKSINGSRLPEARATLEAAAAAHPDVHLIDGYLPGERKNALLAAADCFVSLHRAEGFGLSLAESMYLGKPVIGTRFGGNLEFMDDRNSYLVDWTETTVGGDSTPYPAGARWAEPDLEHAAALMRHVFTDRSEAAERGRRAAATIRERHSPEAAARSVTALLRPARERVGRRLAQSGRSYGAPGMEKLDRARTLLESGPEGGPRRGPGRILRRIARRLFRPVTEWQRWLDETLLDAVEEAHLARQDTQRSLLELQERLWTDAQREARTLARAREAERAVPAPAPAANGGVNGHRPRELEERVRSVSSWWHTIDLGDGVVTPGRKGGGGAYMAEELGRLRLPELRGKSVLDIGAWDGFYSFEAERRGANRVVALDHFVWQQPPGRRGFELAHEALGSSVEAVEADFMELDLAELGRFDVVLFLGVLYHLEEPLRAMRRLAQVTGGLAVIESEAAEWPGQEDRRLCELLTGDELHGDPTNWWVPNIRALTGLCEAAGFEQVDVVQGPPAPASSEPLRYRAIVHASR